jgi:hypothetical protein
MPSIFDSTRRPPGMSYADRAAHGKSRGGEILEIEGLDGDVYATEFKQPDVVKEYTTDKGKKTGVPVPQIIVTLQTNERDPENDQDTGIRTTYIERKSMKKPGTKWRAFIEALEAAGHPKDPRVGGKLWEAVVGEEPVPGFGNDRYLWKMKYEPPSSAVFGQEFSPTTQESELSAQTDPFAENGQQSTGRRVVATRASDIAISPSIQQTESDPFSDNTPEPSADPKALQRSALRLEINDPDVTEDGLKAIWRKAVGAGIADDELSAVITARLQQIWSVPAGPKSPWD